MTAVESPTFGAGALRLQTSRGPAWVVATSAEIPAALRQSAFAGQCKDFRYYEITEETLGTQFDHRFLVLHDVASGEWAIQPLFFTNQDLLAGLPRRLRVLGNFARKLWPHLLQVRTMMLGCAAGEGDLDHCAAWVVPALHEAIDAYRRHAKAFIILLKEFASSYRGTLDPFSRDGYARVPSMPNAKLDLNFASFEEYLTQKLGRVYRKNLRRKFRALKGAPPIEMEVIEDATPFVDELHALYLQTQRRSDFRFEILTKEYFRALGQRMPDRVRFFLWRQQGRIIAYNLCMVHGDTLHDLGLGLDYAVALQLNLYFVTWRDVIEWCLRQGLKTYHTGPLNYDPKAHLKLTLVPQDLYARHQSALLNPLFKLAIRFLEPTRHEPLLRRFPNAHEI